MVSDPWLVSDADVPKLQQYFSHPLMGVGTARCSCFTVFNSSYKEEQIPQHIKSVDSAAHLEFSSHQLKYASIAYVTFVSPKTASYTV